MFFESSLGEVTKLIANGVPKLSSEPSKRSMVFIQSQSVNSGAPAREARQRSTMGNKIW